MSFDPMMRGLLEQSTTSLHQQVVQRLNGLDQQASQMRKNNQNRQTARIPAIELAPDVEKLVSDYDVARLTTIDAINGELSDKRKASMSDRDRHPDRELAAIRRAESHVKGLSDDAVTELASSFVMDDSATMDVPTQNEVLGRLRQAKMKAEHSEMTMAIKARRADQPWMDEEATQLADERDTLSQLSSGEVSLADDQYRTKIPNLIDWHDEMSKQ
jgi:hypothetical protein